MRLSKYFTLEELTASIEATRAGIDNAPDKQTIERLAHLAFNLDSIRDSIGVPLIALSGFRCKALNVKIGGSLHSWHILGQAADLIAPRFGTPLELAKHIEALRAGGVLKAHEIIHEFGHWAHYAIPMPDETPDSELLTYDMFQNKKRRRVGLLPV